MIIVVIIQAVIIAILSYLVYANWKKAERASEYCEAYVRFISALFFSFTETRDKIQEVDRLGAFKADDEVGFIFKEIDQSIDDLYKFITKYVNTAEDKEDEKTKD
jgi:hypothetical protein